MSKKILLIVTGSVAAYKSMDLLRLLKKQQFDVTCILTKAAQEFITPLLASSLSGNKTHDQLFSPSDALGIEHIELSRQADLIVVAPATADFIAKIANGYADDLASSVILAANKKIIIAPAMNTKMWENSATQKNLALAAQNGVLIVEPQSDILACGENGIGKMAEPEKICAKVVNFFENQNLLSNKKVVITGGSTIEPIDPVRFIGNHSSGKQAIALAEVFHEMGADVTFIAGNISQPISLPKNKLVSVKTAQEMFAAVEASLKNSPDIFIGCAAVADFKVKKTSSQKIKKIAQENLILELEQNPDILHFVGHNLARPKMVIGFAAESENLEENARQKLVKKNCDLIVANSIAGGAIFGQDFTKPILVDRLECKNLGEISKVELAQILANFCQNSQNS